MRFKITAASMLAVGMLAMALSGCGTMATEKPAPETPVARVDEKAASKRDSYFVSAEWLKKNSGAAFVWDARDAAAYKAGHIEGAISAPWQMFASVTAGKPGDKGWGTLLSADKIAAQLSAIGVDTSKTIVVYADPSGWGEDGRIVWMLRMAGIADAKMLDGGWPVWQKSGGKTTTRPLALKTTKVAVSALDEDMIATMQDILAKGVKIVDVRTKKEFGGATDFGEARGGHIENAINLPFQDQFNDDGTLKSDEELRELFKVAGLSTEDEIVSYCTKGIRSAHMTLVLRMLGFEKARNYDASYYEWAGDTSQKVVK